ncbi:MAG: hypothetical protein HC838_08460, partial [Spirulinaceae cyanobacterium RM2_2_10]|nr:hypothetical protein [Spirulinaceae cyanobacterium RM2_2_10]
RPARTLASPHWRDSATATALASGFPTQPAATEAEPERVAEITPAAWLEAAIAPEPPPVSTPPALPPEVETPVTPVEIASSDSAALAPRLISPPALLDLLAEDLDAEDAVDPYWRELAAQYAERSASQGSLGAPADLDLLEAHSLLEESIQSLEDILQQVTLPPPPSPTTELDELARPLAPAALPQQPSLPLHPVRWLNQRSPR